MEKIATIDNLKKIILVEFSNPVNMENEGIGYVKIKQTKKGTEIEFISGRKIYL